MAGTNRMIPIYTTGGSLGAYLLYPYLYNVQGEWIGWVTGDRKVYSVHGHFVGLLTDDPRIVRKRSEASRQEEATPPLKPRRIRPPATVPLSPLMRELSFGEIDVLQDEPDLLPTLDHGDLREDMD